MLIYGLMKIVEKAPASYDTLIRLLTFNRIQRAHKLIALEAGEGTSVLDIGCGTGNVSVLCAKSGAHVTSVDSSKEMLSIFKQIFAAAFADRMIFRWPTTSILLIGLLISVVIGTMGMAHVVRLSTAYVCIIASVLITILICLDYLGSTVDYKTTTFHWLKTFNMRSLFQPEVMDNCEGCRECINVCPKNVYYVRSGKTMVNYDNECCECLACVKQCASGAIRNRNKGRWKGDIKTIGDIDRIMK